MKIRKIRNKYNNKTGYITLNTFINEGLGFMCDFIESEWIEISSLKTTKGVEII